MLGGARSGRYFLRHVHRWCLGARRANCAKISDMKRSLTVARGASGVVDEFFVKGARWSLLDLAQHGKERAGWQQGGMVDRVAKLACISKNDTARDDFENIIHLTQKVRFPLEVCPAGSSTRLSDAAKSSSNILRIRVSSMSTPSTGEAPGEDCKPCDLRNFSHVESNYFKVPRIVIK